MRRNETILVAVLALATVIAVVAGLQTAPPSQLRDPRLSTELAGPAGAQALAETVERFGVVVEARRRGLFDLGADTTEVRADDVIALLDLAYPPTEAEQSALVRYVERGGSLLLAGWNFGIEECFDVSVVQAGERRVDSLDVVAPPGVGIIPRATAVLELAPEDGPEEPDDLFLSDPCPVLTPTTADTLLRVQDDRPVALALTYEGGGTVLAVAEPAYLTNKTLKETDAGAMVLPWILAREPRRVLVDEYHQGFGERSSIFGAAWGWMRSSPLGWALLQLGAVALLVIFVAAVRFGPALEVVDRRRRSAIEHVDALAVGLQRASGSKAAVELIVQGLRRRLGRRELRDRSSAALDDWLRTLALSTRAPGAREKIATLGRLAGDANDDSQVLSVAQTVEDVWEALGHEKSPKQF